MRPIPRTAIQFSYDRTHPPVLTVEPGEEIRFETYDPRAGALFDLGPGPLIDLPRPDPHRVNPVTGPVWVQGAELGDVLVAEILQIDLLSPAWVGVKPGVGPVPVGRSLARFLPVEGDRVLYNEAIQFQIRPMIGCIGTAPGGDGVPTAYPGEHGGNMDHATVTTGSRVYLPVWCEGALFALGDVHAAMGDGELSSIAAEIRAEVTVRLSLVKGGYPLRRPVIETAQTIATTANAPDFETARRLAAEEMVSLLAARLGLSPEESMMLLSAAGDLRIGQACGGMDLTLRLEVPRFPGLTIA
jgi:amidase